MGTIIFFLYLPKIIGMKSKVRIIQKQINLDIENISNYIIIIEIQDSLPKYHYMVKIPQWFKYYDEFLRELTASLN